MRTEIIQMMNVIFIRTFLSLIAVGIHMILRTSRIKMSGIEKNCKLFVTNTEDVLTSNLELEYDLLIINHRGEQQYGRDTQIYGTCKLY